jgi:hypothetical protein
MMRRILVDGARTRRVDTRDGEHAPTDIDIDTVTSPSTSVNIMAVDDAFRRLIRLNPRQGQLGELRCFWGLTLAETATLQLL